MAKSKLTSASVTQDVPVRVVRAKSGTATRILLLDKLEE